MAQTPTVAPVNTTAVDLLSAAGGKVEVAHFFLVAETDRDGEKATRWIDQAIVDLTAAKEAIRTSGVRQVRQLERAPLEAWNLSKDRAEFLSGEPMETREIRRPVAVGQQLLERDL